VRLKPAQDKRVAQIYRQAGERNREEGEMLGESLPERKRVNLSLFSQEEVSICCTCREKGKRS